MSQHEYNLQILQQLSKSESTFYSIIRSPIINLSWVIEQERVSDFLDRSKWLTPHGSLCIKESLIFDRILPIIFFPVHLLVSFALLENRPMPVQYKLFEEASPSTSGNQCIPCTLVLSIFDLICLGQNRTSQKEWWYFLISLARAIIL